MDQDGDQKVDLEESLGPKRPGQTDRGIGGAG